MRSKIKNAAMSFNLTHKKKALRAFKKNDF